MSTHSVLNEIRMERARWGEQDHPDGTGSPGSNAEAEYAHRICAERSAAGKLTWQDVLYGAVAEAFACEDIGELRRELVQVAAVATAWMEAIDRRSAPAQEARL